MSEAPDESLVERRYGVAPGRRRRDRRTVIVAASLLVAGTLAWGIWTLTQGTFSSIEADDAGYTVVDDTTVSVAYTLSAPTGQNVQCALQAMDESKATVGWVVVDVPPGTQQTRTLSAIIRTVARPTTGLVAGCWAS